MAKKEVKQSGVIPFRRRKGNTEIVLVRSNSKKSWIIPKGMIEKCMSSHKSAAKEALEEAGVVGTVSKRELGKYTYKKSGSNFRVSMYKLRVEKILRRWAEKNDRSRRIVPIEKAIKLVKKEQRDVLKSFHKKIQ